MADYAAEQNKLISTQQVEALTAIYDDYSYLVREYEQFLLLSPLGELAEEQKKSMYPDGYAFPWNIKPMNVEERREFTKYSKIMLKGTNNRSYVSLQHIKTKENSDKSPIYAIPPYKNLTVRGLLPSSIECYTISYPQETTLGNTELYIDGRYKVVYTGEKDKDKSLTECLNDADFQTEFAVMLKIGECLRKNYYIQSDKFESEKQDIYTDERVQAIENNLLEIIGSFGERVKDICNEKYGDDEAKKNHQNDSKNNVMRAQREGFMNLPENIWDYVDLRNFIRHQWETLGGWEDFMPKTYKDSKTKHADRVKAYFNFCDEPIFLRLKNYLKVLHQMQKVIAAVNPKRIIRHKSVSDRKFKKRLELRSKQNPGQNIEAEINYPQMSDKYEYFKGEIPAIAPNIRIVDDNYESDDKFNHMHERMEAYKKRSWFLQAFHSLEMLAIRYCITRGINSTQDKDGKIKNLMVRDAWDYLRNTGVITQKECSQWQYYTKLRKKISHYYFDEGLKEELDSKEAQFLQDLTDMNQKLHNVGPDVSKQQDGTFKCTNLDGKVVVLDFDRHLILEGKEEPIQSFKASEKADFANKTHSGSADKPYTVYTRKNRSRKIYPNGVEIEDDGKKVTGIKFPNDIFINMENQSIHWGKNAHWYGSAQFFNALQINHSTVQTNKKLRVTEYRIGQREQDFDYGDHLLIDKHCVVIDDNGFIKEFDFKDAGNNIIQTKFKRTDAGQSVVLFEDKTAVVFSGKDVSVVRNDKVLNLDNRDAFALSYGNVRIMPQQFSKRGNSRS